MALSSRVILSPSPSQRSLNFSFISVMRRVSAVSIHWSIALIHSGTFFSSLWEEKTPRLKTDEAGVDALTAWHWTLVPWRPWPATS